VQVHGYNNVTGNFKFFVKDLGGAPTFDTCEEAGGPVPFGETVPITLASNLMVDSGILTCAPPSGSTTTVPGIWLYAFGDGGEITASVCENAVGAASIYVYEGDCSSPQCVEFVNDACSVTWSSEVDEVYYVFVSTREPRVISCVWKYHCTGGESLILLDVNTTGHRRDRRRYRSYPYDNGPSCSCKRCMYWSYSSGHRQWRVRNGDDDISQFRSDFRWILRGRNHSAGRLV
jgi:hypothetical protein